MSLSLDIKAIASPQLLRRGAINVIGLDAVRARTGARWERMRDSIYARLETLLSHKLGPTDFFVRLGELTYLVATPSCDGEDARMCCLKIAYELQCSLFGTCAVADLSLSRVCGEGSSSLELHALGQHELVELALRGGVEELYRDAIGMAGAHHPPAPFGAPALRERPPVFRYAPIWNVAHEAITGYRLEVQPGTPSRPAQSPLPQEDFRDELKLFLAGLARAAETLSARLHRGGCYLLVVPILYDILSAPAGRMEVAAACRNLPAELRAFLVFMLAGVPVGVPQSRLGDLVCSIRPFCKTVTVDLPIGQWGLASYKNAGIPGVGLVLPAPMPMAVVRDDIAKLGAAAKRLGLTSLVIGVPSRDVADCARSNGIHYLSGPFIGAAVESPQPMRRHAWDDLVRRERDAIDRALDCFP